MNTQEIIDKERGYLDRKNGQSIGFSGPVTSAYLLGFGTDFDCENRMRAFAEYKNNHIEHGWHT